MLVLSGPEGFVLRVRYCSHAALEEPAPQDASPQKEQVSGHCYT
jgi:hypothetical protein